MNKGNGKRKNRKEKGRKKERMVMEKKLLLAIGFEFVRLSTHWKTILNGTFPDVILVGLFDSLATLPIHLELSICIICKVPTLCQVIKHFLKIWSLVRVRY